MNRILVSLGVIFFCFSGCKKSSNPVDPPSVVSFDLSLGKTWKYAWSSVLSDSTGKILNSETDSFQVRIASINDSLKNYTELIRFEAQSIPHYRGVSQVWYKFAGDSLVEIAYNQVYNGLTLPKRSKSIVEAGQANPALFLLFPNSIFTLMKLKGLEDSVIFRDNIRIVYKFPLSERQKWTSFNYPFLQTREVVGAEFVNQYYCAKILTKLPDFAPDIGWYDYVAREGLIKRKIVIDSLSITTTSNPEGTGAYGRSEEILELLN
jgi:hypothetical protein